MAASRHFLGLRSLALRTRSIATPRSRLVVAAVLVASIAHADDLDPIRTAIPTCDATRTHCFGLQLHVAPGEHGLIASPEWLAAQVAIANKHFAPLDIGFQLAGVDTLPDSAVHIETRADRDALAADRLGGRMIHVFIVGQLDDVDDHEIVYGVTWHARRDDRKYVIVSAKALERTLAHELGHFFGLPHSTYAVSIMNKSAREEPPVEQRTFADEEIAAMRPALKRLLRDKVIADVPRSQ